MAEAKHFDPELPFADQLDTWLAHLAHRLPAQAPIADFVHHNTLHGYQHLPFPEALATVADETGARPYWPPKHFLELFAEGRINQVDLDAVLREHAEAGPDTEIMPGLSRLDVQRANLLACGAPAPATLAWQMRETSAVDRAVLEHFNNLFPATLASEDWRNACRARWHQRWAQLGTHETPAELLAALSGCDPLAPLRTLLQRQWAAWLDLGIAAWPVPDGDAGFLDFWRRAAEHDLAWELEELPAMRDELLDLPTDPVEALRDWLPRLHPEPEVWPTLLERLAQRRPGWAGMFLRQSQAQARAPRPTDMRDFLAVAVLIETVVSEDLVRRLTGGAMQLDEMAGWCEARPEEMRVREALTARDVPEALAHRAHHLCAQALLRRVPDADWLDLAESLVAAEAGECHPALRLLSICRQLNLSEEQLLALTPATASDILNALPDDACQHGQIWLEAYERHYRESLFSALAANQRRQPASTATSVSAQVIFCMDDREEGTRRHLEELAPDIQTYGAAGFFGVAMYWQGLDDLGPVALCPVVVTPNHRVSERPRSGQENRAIERAERRASRQRWRENLQQWPRRAPLLGTATSLLAAPFALTALAARALAPGWFGYAQQRWHAQSEPKVATELTLTAESPGNTSPQIGFQIDEQADRVAAFLRTIGLTRDFAPLVVLLGHGSNSLNNPHQSAYDCGACSGRHGGPNARVFAAMANRPEVRQVLAEGGLNIPDTCHFIAGEHNTCDDRIEWYDLDTVPTAFSDAVDRLIGQLSDACRAHAAERCRRLASAPPRLSPWQGFAHVLGRRHDLSQARPELGHATNAAAFIGRRAMSRGLFLDRRVFLISYDPEGDGDGSIVESILLAAGPVGAGINLEYYFSTVDNERFGCGSKVTHNLTGRFGVMEGAESDLRTGLPWQMVEIHEPMRLLVVVEQTPEILSAIVARQAALRELIDNAWIVLAAKSPVHDASTAGLWLYRPGHGWQAWDGPAVLPQVARSADWFAGESEALPPALLLGGTC